MIQGWNVDRSECQEKELKPNSTEGSDYPLLSWRVMILGLVYSLLNLTNKEPSFYSREYTEHRTTSEIWKA